METRRIRRLERRRVHRTIALTAAIAAFGVAVGMTLPRSTPASVVVLAAAVMCAAFVATGAESIAPLHGLHRVVRLPWRRSLAATLASFASRVAGSARAWFRRAPQLTPIVLDEPDDEAEAWWGASSAPPNEADVEPPAQVELAPVLAAAVTSAHVPAGSGEQTRWAKKARAGLRHRFATLARRMEQTEEVGAST
jgi:hypothetical protein